MTTFTIYAKTTAAGSGGYGHTAATTSSGNPMTRTPADDGYGWQSSSSFGVEVNVGVSGNSYREGWEHFYAFDVSSLSGQTITASSVLFNKS